MDASAIEKIQEYQTIVAAGDAVREAFAVSRPVVALPDGFSINSIEHLLPAPIRFRGTMKTSVLESFCDYCKNADAVFVDPDTMSATAFLDLGEPDLPRHGEHKAVLKLKPTAEYKALQAMTEAGPLRQQLTAEWLEDWIENIMAFDGDGRVITPHALVQTIRRMKINATRSGEHKVDNFRSERSAMESVEAESSVGKLPDRIEFRCIPYNGLEKATIPLRMSVLTQDGDAPPKFNLRIRAEEKLVEQWAEELAARLRKDLHDIRIGTFEKR